MTTWFFHELKSSRLARFFLVHAVISIVVGCMIIKSFTHNQGTIFPRYFITFGEAFFGSLGGALLTLALLLKDFFMGFGGAGSTTIDQHSIPLPFLAGLAAFFGFIFIAMGIRASRTMGMYFFFVWASLLLIYSSYVYFVDIPAAARSIIGF